MTRRKTFRLVLLVALLIVCMLSIHAVVARNRLYTSKAQLLVVKKSADRENENTLNEDILSNQQVILKSRQIALRATRIPKIVDRLSCGPFKSFATVASTEELVTKLQAGLAVTRDKSFSPAGNQIIALSFACADPVEAQMILTAVMQAYEEYIEEIYRDMPDGVVREINRIDAKLQLDILEADEALLRFAHGKENDAEALEREKARKKRAEERKAAVEKIVKDAMKPASGFRIVRLMEPTLGE